MRLEDLGWDETFARAWAAWADRSDFQPGRVAIEYNQIFKIYSAAGDVEAVTAGRLKHKAASRSELPAVGDWVVLRRPEGQDRASIQAVLPRRTRFSRKAAGQTTDEQVVAANIDVVFLVMALDQDFSVRRLERYLLLARDSGAAPVVILTKPDLSDRVAEQLAEVSPLAGALPVHVVQPKGGEGLEQVAGYLPSGRTGALLGSSGVGKTTVINGLVGYDLRKTALVRDSDSKGRHTTTHRELVVLPTGGLIIDTPGMRELQLWDGGDAAGGAVGDAFADIEALAAGCHFSDCRHSEEPRCAVKAAVAANQLAAGRLEGYRKLQGELAHLARQQDDRLQLDARRHARTMGKALRARVQEKGRT